MISQESRHLSLCAVRVHAKKEGKRNKQFIKKMKLLRNVSKFKYMENNWFYSRKKLAPFYYLYGEQTNEYFIFKKNFNCGNILLFIFFLLARDITSEFNGLIYRFQKLFGLFIEAEHLVI